MFCKDEVLRWRQTRHPADDIGDERSALDESGKLERALWEHLFDCAFSELSTWVQLSTAPC